MTYSSNKSACSLVIAVFIESKTGIFDPIKHKFSIMLIWAASTIIVGFVVSYLMVILTCDSIKSFYPKTLYLDLGEKINEGKSYTDINRLNYSFLVPKFSKIRFFVNTKGWVYVFFNAGFGFMFYYILGSILGWIVGLFSEDKITIYTDYRNWTTVILYMFISVLVPCALIEAHFIEIKNIVKNNGLQKAPNRPRLGMLDDDTSFKVKW